MEGINLAPTRAEAEHRDLRERVLRLEAKHEELSHSVNSYAHQRTWQFVGFTLTMVITVWGAFYWQTSVLDKRLERFEKNISARLASFEENTHRHPSAP